MGNDQFVVFRLKTGKKDGTYTLKRGMGLKDGVMMNIGYRPGAKSIFDDDNEKSAIKPQAVVFRYNDLLNDPAVELIVPKTDKSLLDYLTIHQLFGRDYDIYDADKEALKDLSIYDDKEKAFEYIRESDDIKAKAKAMVIFGLGVYNESLPILKKRLKETADKNPKVVIKAFEAQDYEGKYIASLAFCAGIIKNNLLHTSVIWNDASEGTIVSVAKGENGVDKVAELISTKSEQSETLLQEFHARLKKAGAKEDSGMTFTEGIVAEKDIALSAAEQKIKDLEKKLAALSGAQPAKDYSNLTIAEATELYIKQEGKEPHHTFRDNLEKIVSKLT